MFGVSVNGTAHHPNPHNAVTRWIASVLMACFLLVTGAAMLHVHHHEADHVVVAEGVVHVEHADHDTEGSCSLCKVTATQALLPVYHHLAVIARLSDMHEPVVRSYVDQRCAGTLPGRDPPFLG